MRINRRVVPYILLITAALTPTGCETDSITPANQSDSIPTIAVTNYPLRYFVERIGGPRFAVQWLVPEGVDPADWQPTTDDMVAMNGADLVLINGAGYESWLETVSLAAEDLVDTSAGFKDRLIETGGRVHSHGPDGSHSHAGTATHTWMDPDLAILQADAVLKALVALSPADQERLQSNFGVLRRDLVERSAGLEQAVNAAPATPVLFSHPVYQYLQRRYRMNGHSVHFEPEVDPDPAGMAELGVLLAATPTTWCVWEGTPSDGNAAMLRSRGIRSVVFDPGGSPPASGDLLDLIDVGIASLRTVYGATDDS